MSLIEEIRLLAPEIHPRSFAARIAYWRRGGLPAGGLAERVGGSREHKLPAFDTTDARLNEAEADYREAVDGFVAAMSVGDHRAALRCLRKAETLEQLWLKPFVTPDKEMAKQLNKLASDAQACNTCDDTKEAWVLRQKKKGVKSPLWRTKGGDCQACYQTKRRARLVEMELIDPDSAAALVTMAAEGTG